MAEIAKIVQGNNFNVAIPLKVYILNEGEVVLQDFTPAEGDDVTIRLVGERRGYTYKPTIEGNVAHLQLSGHEVCDTYAVEVVIIGPDGTMLRSYRGDQLAIVYNVDTIIADGAVEEGELYLDSQFFIQGQKGEQGDPGQDGTDGQDGQDGQDGADGRGIVSITKTATAGLVDTYTITYTDGTTSTFEVTNGQSGGGEDALIVTLTYQSGTYIADKTYNEITAAIQAGRNVLVFSSVSQNYATLSRATSGKVEFSHIESVGSQMMGQFLVCHSNNTWATSSKTIQQELVSGTSIKTINSTSLLGSGDIVVAEEFIVNVTYSGGTYTADKTPQECCIAFLDGKRVVFVNTASTPLYGDSRTFIATSVSVYNQYNQWNIYAVSGNGRGDAKVDILCYEKQINTSLTFKTITAQVNADWNASSGVAQILNKPTIPDLATYCPIIEDTRQSQVAAITGVAPFASLVDGQRIVLRLAYATVNNSTLSLNGGTAYDVYGTWVSQAPSKNISGIAAGSLIPLIFEASNNRWLMMGNKDTNTTYYSMSQAEIDAGSVTSSRVITPKLLCDNFQKHTAIETIPSGAIAPTAGYEPNKMYDFGKVSSVVFSSFNTASEIANSVNLYMCTFQVASGGTTLSLNANTMYPNGEDANSIEGLLSTEDRVFEITIRRIVVTENNEDVSYYLMSYLYFD